MTGARFGSAVAAVLLVVSWGARAAEGEGPGQLVSMACGVVPPKSHVDVQASDDTARDKALRDAIAAELTRAGYVVAADATVRVTFDAEIERALDPSRQGYLGKLNSTNRDTTFELNLWTSSGDSVLGGVTTQGAATGPNMSHLTISAHDKTNGKCLWQGEARHPTEGGSEVEFARRLVPVVLGHFGKTLPATAFSLDD